ncbi:MAG: hypothetical protein HHAS10_06480 [Candidatus Altimarinota bacterium]
MDIHFFHKIISSTSRSIPLIIDENTALLCLSDFLGTEIGSFDDCKTGNFSNIYLYEKEEEKVYITVNIIRNWIRDLSEKPYAGKNLFILRYFDEATHQAMNAALKALEEPPIHAIILLVVKNPEGILDTIRSRTINMFSSQGYTPLSREIVTDIEDFIEGRRFPLLTRIQSGKLDEFTTILVLKYIIDKGPEYMVSRLESCIDDLLEVHESPRNILDRAIIYM